MALKVITPPAEEPVTIDEARAQCRVDGDDEDTLIDGYITTARIWVEGFANRALISRTLEWVLDAFPCSGTIELPLPPLGSVTSLKYTDAAGVESTFSADNYLVDADGVPGRLALRTGYTWPAVTLQAIAGVRVRFVAGYGAAADVPRHFRQAILLLVGHYYENREEVQAGSGIAITQIPMGVRSLLWVDRNKHF